MFELSKIFVLPRHQSDVLITVLLSFKDGVSREKYYILMLEPTQDVLFQFLRCQRDVLIPVFLWLSDGVLPEKHYFLTFG